MQMAKVARLDWPEFFKQFSRAHHGQEVLVTTGDGDEIANMRDLPLIGVTLEDTSLIISAGGGGAHADHTIANPRNLAAREWNDGVSAEMAIESDDGQCTHVRVGPAEQMLAPGVILDGYFKRE